MSDPATGDIEARGITPQTDFKDAASATPAPARPYITFPIKPDVVKKVISQLDEIKGRTKDSKITVEQTAGGGTKYSLIDKRDNQPLAVMNARGDDATVTLYKSPEALAKRIDSIFVSQKKITEFIESNTASHAIGSQPQVPRS
jgi:hypothetical protein